MYSLYDEPRSNRLSLLTVTVIAVVTVAGIVGNLYTYQIFTKTVKDLENRVATLQIQVSALTAALGNYSQVTVSNVSLSELYDSAKNSVVLVRGQTPGGMSIGSGFVYHYNISDQMVIITNYHVIEGTSTHSVTFRNGHAYSAQLMGFDIYADLAVLSVDNAPGEEFKPLQIVSSSLVNVGDLVIAIGNPYELVGSMTTGVVSQLKRAVPDELAGGFPIANVIQISAPLNPGNSGGPLLNTKGQVVGVNFAIVANSTGVGFAIPSNTILRELAWLVRGDTYPHSWIGIAGTDMTYERNIEMGASATYGWLIIEVVPNSPASRAELKADDIILALNGTRIINGDDLSSYLEEKTSPSNLLVITIERATSEMNILLTLGTRP